MTASSVHCVYYGLKFCIFVDVDLLMNSNISCQEITSMVFSGFPNVGLFTIVGLGQRREDVAGLFKSGVFGFAVLLGL
jgi:hypothetical protein